MSHRFSRIVAAAALAAALIVPASVIAPASATDAHGWPTATDGFPAGAPAGADWQPTIHASSLPEFVATYPGRVSVVRIDGVMQLARTRIGVDVLTAVDLPGDATVATLAGPTSTLTLTVGDLTPLTVQVEAVEQ